MDEKSGVVSSEPQLKASIPSSASLNSRTKLSSRAPSKSPQWQFWKKEKDYFDGKRHFREGYHYRRPNRTDIEKTFYNGRRLQQDETEYRHLDIFGRETFAKKNTLTYISPTESLPKPLMVQATQDTVLNQPQGDWRRVKLKGNVPSVLKISVWALQPSNWFLRGVRVILVVIPILVLLSLPLEKAWESSEFDDSYTEFPNYCWEYPKHARNRLDTKPHLNGIAAPKERGDQNLSTKVRLLRPRILVTYVNGQWVLDTSPQRHQKYLFISYTNIHFPTRHPEPQCAEEEKLKVENIARERTLGAGLGAYWIDTRCCAPEEEVDLHTADVHRMCDVIRGAEHICIVLPKINLANKKQWGARMWTLPEALLARKQELIFASPKNIEVLSKLDMTDEVWDDGESVDGEHQSTRLLAEHFSSVLTLGRLELFSVALDALSHRSQSGDFSQGDVAYALMGLLHYRIPLDRSDTLFQALARLSLANDSDRLIERMVCMLPNYSRYESKGSHNTFLELTEQDEFGSQLWDIEPLCQVAGVGYGDGDVILDSCRGVSIRWKSFPQMKYKRSAGFWKLVSEVVLRSGAYWAALGLALMIKYIWSYVNDEGSFVGNLEEWYASEQYSRDVGLVFLGSLAIVFALLLTLGAPSAVRKLYGGRVMQSAPWLVGFEGTLPSDKLEEIIFGNSGGRLSYAPSSTPLSYRQSEDRIGAEPGWVRDRTEHSPPPLPKGHRFYTLVDTGSLEISIFSAVRPPSVALIAGREGGMLRTVLCHYERSSNCLYKETVMRMDSVTLNQGTLFLINQIESMIWIA